MYGCVYACLYTVLPPLLIPSRRGKTRDLRPKSLIDY